MSEIIPKEYIEPEYIEPQAVRMGAIHISNDVVSKIVGIAAQATSGISSMSVGLTEGIAKSISGKSLQKALTLMSKMTRPQFSCVSMCSTGSRCIKCAKNFNTMYSRPWSR